MKTTRTKTAAFIALTVLAVWACDPAEMTRDAMVDASETMMDASEMMMDAAGGLDGASSDASAQTTREVTCTPHVFRWDHTTGARGETTTWAAVIDDPSITPGMAIRIVRCDRTYLGTSTAPTSCPAAPEFSCSGEEIPNLRCTQTDGGAIEDGRLVVHCGSHSQSYDAAGALTGDTGSRWTTVTVTY